MIGTDAAVECIGTYATRCFAGQRMPALAETLRQLREVGAPANGLGFAAGDVTARAEQTDERDRRQYAPASALTGVSGGNHGARFSCNAHERSREPRGTMEVVAVTC